MVGALNGGLMPVFGLILGKVLAVLSKLDAFRNKDYKGTQSKEDIIWEDD